ncbi:hypothetical protein OAP32_00285 [Crocinitomicaceae bacterium]|nr:hypothetical protein [Crocinitomicaceae bacterium]
MNSKVKVLSIVSISALLLMIILYAAGVFKSGPESYLEDTSCTYCPGANYLEFFKSNFDEENLTIKMYQSKAKTEIIRVNAIEPKKDTTLFFFEVSVDSLKSVDPLIFLKMKVKGNDYPANSAYVKHYFSRRCANIQVDGSDSYKLLPDDYPFPVRLDSIMKNQNMIFTDDVKLTDSLGTAWKYVMKEYYRYSEIKVSPYYNKEPFNGYIYYGPKIGESHFEFCWEGCIERIESGLIGYSNGKKSGLTYTIDGYFRYLANNRGRGYYSHSGNVKWTNSITLYKAGKILKKIDYEIIDHDKLKGRKYGLKYIWDLNFSISSKQHILMISHFNNEGKEHGKQTAFYNFGYALENNRDGWFSDYFREFSWNLNLNKIENLRDPHIREEGSFSNGIPSGEWIKYFFDGRVKEKVTYDKKGEEIKHIEYDYDGLIKSNTGYKN